MNHTVIVSDRIALLGPLYDDRMNEAHSKAVERFGSELLTFTIGDPRLKSEEFVAMLAGFTGQMEGHGYSIPTWGNRDFLTAIAAYRERVEKVKLEPDEICAIRGSRLGLTLAMLAWTNPGDAVMLPNLDYPGKFNALVNACCEPVYYNVRPEAQDVFAEIEAAYYGAVKAGKKVKLLTITSPGNPHGRALRKSFYPKLISFCEKHNLHVFSDEAYLQNVYNGRAYSLQQFDGGKEVGVSIRTFSKLRNMPDIRAAFIDGNKAMINAAKNICRGADYGLSDAIQKLVCYMLEPRFDDFPAESNLDYQMKDTILRTTLNGCGIDVWENVGAMFGAVVVPPRLQPLGSHKVTALVLEECGVRVNAGSAHGPGGGDILRFAYTQDDDTTRTGANRLGRFLSSYELTSEQKAQCAQRVLA